MVGAASDLSGEKRCQGLGMDDFLGLDKQAAASPNSRTPPDGPNGKGSRLEWPWMGAYDGLGWDSGNLCMRIRVPPHPETRTGLARYQGLAG